MKYKKLLSTLLIPILMLIGSIQAHALGKDSFDTNNIYKTIREISSSEYGGRLTGDKGNIKTQEYIQKYFKTIGLEPLGDNKTYLQEFDIVVPSLNGNCYFKVLDKNKKVIKDYIYGTDFKENPYGASTNGIVNGTARVKLSDGGNILLMSNGRIGEQEVDYQMDITLKEKGIKAVVSPTNMNYRFRSPYKLQSNYPEGIVKVMVTKKVFDELMNYQKDGYTLEIKSSLQVKKIKANNVLGVIRGKNPTLPPLILSAHFDHVGLDADGVLYPGALDNASGVAVLLESARVLKSVKNLERTVIFAAFNGEEVGLVGSEYFVKHPPMNIKAAECINFDMVATTTDMPLSLLSYGADDAFSKELEAIAKANGIKTKLLNENNSDHGPFCANGINAVTLIYDDVTKIHTPKDDLSNIDSIKTLEVFSLVSSYLSSRNIETAFSYKVQNTGRDYKFLIISLGFVAVFAIIALSKNRKQSR
jgi:aminopeptidase YwaD